MLSGWCPLRNARLTRTIRQLPIAGQRHADATECGGIDFADVPPISIADKF
jgi:hypothetical protein